MLKIKTILAYLFIPSIVLGQVQGYQYEPIQVDTTFQPYVNFDSQSGN
jgi:hypothetical protein